jgi:sulfate adenylyltransferase subunit 1 (EFTu-like GTPase family)
LSVTWKSTRHSFVLSRRGHVGENINRDLQSAVEEFNYKTTANIPTIVCDQGSNVLLAAKLMRWYKINCEAHVFNLVIVNDGYKKNPAFFTIQR